MHSTFISYIVHIHIVPLVPGVFFTALTLVASVRLSHFAFVWSVSCLSHHGYFLRIQASCFVDFFSVCVCLVFSHQIQFLCFWQEYHTSDVCFSVHYVRRHMVSVCSIAKSCVLKLFLQITENDIDYLDSGYKNCSHKQVAFCLFSFPAQSSEPELPPISLSPLQHHCWDSQPPLSDPKPYFLPIVTSLNWSLGTSDYFCYTVSLSSVFSQFQVRFPWLQLRFVSEKRIEAEYGEGLGARGSAETLPSITVFHILIIVHI